MSKVKDVQRERQRIDIARLRNYILYVSFSDRISMMSPQRRTVIVPIGICVAQGVRQVVVVVSTE